MAQDVTIRMSAQDAGAFAAWKQQQQGVRDVSAEVAKLIQHMQGASGSVKTLAFELDQIATRAGRVGNATGSATGKMDGLTSSTGKARQAMGSLLGSSTLTRWIGLGTAIGTASTGLHKLVAAIKAVKQEEAQTTVTLDEQFRRFATQAQLTPAEFKPAQQVFFETAKAEAMPVETVVEAAKQLVSSGFSKEEVLRGGGALREMAMAIKATTAEGKDFDVRQASESITQFIMAQVKPEDRALTRDNLRKTLRATQGLYVQRNIQFEDLTDLAKAAPALSGAGIDTVTQLAMFTKLRDTLDAEQSATSLRNLVIRMTTAGGSKAKVEALAKMGLRPEDIDLEGEDIETALARMKAGIDKLSPAAATGVLKTLFEERGMLGARTLIENYQQISQYRGEALDTTRFDTAHAWATAGYHAGDVREEILKQEARFMGEGAFQSLIAKDIEAHTPGAAGKLLREAFEAAVGAGLSTEMALKNVIGLPSRIARVPDDQIKREMRGYITRAEEVQTRSDVIRGSVPTAAPGSARPWNQTEFEANEAKLAAERKRAVEKVEADKKSELIGRQGAGGLAARQLVLAAASRELERDGYVHDPEELAQIQGRAIAEALAADQALSLGRISQFTPEDAAELHRRMDRRLPRNAYAPGEGAPDRELRDRVDQMIRILEQIRDEKQQTQPVRIENPDEPDRYKRRKRPPGSPPKGLASY